MFLNYLAAKTDPAPILVPAWKLLLKHSLQMFSKMTIVTPGKVARAPVYRLVLKLLFLQSHSFDGPQTVGAGLSSQSQMFPIGSFISCQKL